MPKKSKQDRWRDLKAALSSAAITATHPETRVSFKFVSLDLVLNELQKVDEAPRLTVVKLNDNEKRPVYPLCAIEGYCCYERAYAIGRIDQKNGLPLSKPKRK